MRNESFDVARDGSAIAELKHDIQKDLLNLLDWSNNIMYERFRSTKIYAKIHFLHKHQKSSNIKALNYKEQEILEVEIYTCFASFIGNLKKCCSYLTKKELLICCLFLLRFSPLTISLSLGYDNTNCIKTHKNRIKRKMVECSGLQFLFDFIFM